MNILDILAVGLRAAKLFTFPGDLCNTTGNSNEETRETDRKARGSLLFGWLKCSELFKSWKGAISHTLKSLPSGFYHSFLTMPSHLNHSVFMKIEAKSLLQRMHWESQATRDQTSNCTRVRVPRLGLLLYTLFFLMILVLLASSQGQELITPYSASDKCHEARATSGH